MESLRDDIASTARPAERGLLSAAFWWLITLGTLIVLDDLTFGPVFWILSRWHGPTTATIVAFTVYFGTQVYLVRRGTSSDPGPLAEFFLRRLRLDRRSNEVATRERALQAKVVGVSSSIALAPIVGGVLPPLILYKRGYERRLVRRLSYVTAVIYAVEFSILHGWIPGSIGR